MLAVLVVQVLTTVWLAGMIWTIQVVHYPLFELANGRTFVTLEAEHASRMWMLLAIPWVAQGVTTAWILVSRPVGVPWWMVLTATGLAATSVLVTVFVSVPLHGVLGQGFDSTAHARLVRTNWWRTVAWSGHAGLAVWMLVRHLRAIPAAV